MEPIMKKNAKNATKNVPVTVTVTEEESLPKPGVTGPVVTLALIEAMVNADSIDVAYRYLAPPARVSADATYTLNTACTEPLPQKRGACLKVVAVAARLQRPFKVADITAALPDVKGAKYWVGRLARTGHFTATE
jgi:hypothetical protein